MRIAVLADIHGNLPALLAVLGELDGDPVDALVVAGDAVGGPLVAETLTTLENRPEPVYWIAGNGEREAFAVHGGGQATDDEPGRAAAWSARALDDEVHHATLAAAPFSRVLDEVLFCHGSPRRDDEILTRATPDDAMLTALAGSDQALVVGGHTHQQFIRHLRPGLTYANAGSVGVPYEGRAAAFWMIVADGIPQLRETGYDIREAAEQLRRSGFPDTESLLDGSLLDPIDPDWVTALFEHTAGRREHPGEPRRGPGEPRRPGPGNR
jgi:putative phosphoesterase